MFSKTLKTITMKKLFFLFFLILALNALHAQKRIDIFTLAGNYNFMNSEYDNNNYESAIMANLVLPIVLKDSSIWYTSVDYQYFSVNNDTNLTSLKDDFKVHGIILRTGLVYKLSSKTNIQILFAPRYMSDFNASFSESLQLGGVFMFEKVKSPTYTYRVGVLYNQECFGPYVVPVFYLDWSVTSKFKIWGMLPIYGKIYYQPNENVSAGIHFIGLTTTYKINEPGLENYYIDRRSIDLSLFSNVHLFSNFYLEGRAGYSLTRDYGLFAEDDKITLGLPLVNIGDDRTRQNNEFSGSPFIQLKLLYSLPIK
jgi:hypothetical protein